MKIFGRSKDITGLTDEQKQAIINEPEFYGKTRNKEQYKKALEIKKHAKAVANYLKETYYNTSDLENQFYPDASIELSFPEHTFIQDEKTRAHFSAMFELADYVSIGVWQACYADITFIVLNVWEA